MTNFDNYTTSEEYVTIEAALLMKKAGFDWWCDKMLGTSVRHNGEEIDEDEEYELKAERRGKEIEYVPFSHVYSMYSNNKRDGKYACALPTQSRALKWLRKIKGCSISIHWDWDSENNCERWYWQHHVELRPIPTIEYYDEPEQAIDAAIEYALKNLI